jgi:hypothetical protein
MAKAFVHTTHREQTKAEFYALLDAGHSARAAGRQTGLPVTTAIRLAKAYRQAIHALLNGDAEPIAETTALATREAATDVSRQAIVQSIPIVEAIVPRLDNHEARILALECWLTSVQQRSEPTTATLQTTARLHSEPARPRSIQMETDLFDTLKSFAKAEHREMKEVVDTALSAYFALHGWTVAEGER